MSAYPDPLSPSESPSPQALIIEPDATTRQLCHEVLQTIGFAFHDVQSGIAAAVAARLATPDLILMAQQLPDVPAREAITWLRSNPALKTVPIIVLSAIGESDDPAGPHILLCKPFSAAALGRTIRMALK